MYVRSLQVIDFIPYQGDLTRYSGFVFTSSNGVRAAKRWNLPARLGFGERSRQSLRVHIVIQFVMVDPMSRR